MIQSANKYQISDILGVDAKVKYVIPKYQREYVWGRDNWEKLFNDIMENEGGHFLGSIICVNRSEDALELVPLELVDGQQRLTTISLLYAAIFDRLANLDPQDPDIQYEMNNLRYRLTQRSKKDQTKLEPSHQNYNYSDYLSVLGDLGLVPQTAKQAYFGHRRTAKAFQFFKRKLAEVLRDSLLSTLEKLNSALLVKIEVNSHADAFILFESLNNRGIPLSAMDLIKNSFLAKLERTGELDLDDAFKEWTRLVERVPDYAVQERFLRQYYNAFRFQFPNPPALRATRPNLIKVYETLIDRDVKPLFDDLIQKSSIYHALISPEGKFGSPQLVKHLVDLDRLGAAPSFAFLLYLFTMHATNTRLLEEVCHLLVKYTVRRSLTDYPNTRDLDSIFMGLIDHCQSLDVLTADAVADYLFQPGRCADASMFEQRLRANIYDDNADLTRFLLCALEEQHQTLETKRDMWAKNGNTYIWTIEHIFPEGENIPGCWVTMIAGGDSNRAGELQLEWVHKIGNLTMSAYNPNLSNSCFSIKRDKVDAQGNPIGYRNGLYLNLPLRDKVEWTVADIESRTDSLVREILGLFAVSRVGF